MSLYFITGAPGAGKSAVTTGMEAKGYAIYDTDDPERTGMAGWHSLETGEYVAGYNEVEVTERLLKTHLWKLTDAALEGFVERAESESIYLCGRLRDARPVIEVADRILFLRLPDAVVDERLIRRSQIPGEVEWGGEPWQREKSMQVNRQIEEEYRALGAVMINADQPRELVVAAVIEATT